MDKFHFHKYRTISQNVLPSGKDTWSKVYVIITKKCDIFGRETYLISTANGEENNSIVGN